MRGRLGPWLRRAWWEAGAGPRALSGTNFPGVLVLAYHGIKPADAAPDRFTFSPLHVPEALFDEHCACFRKYCTVISGDDWLAIARGVRSIPPRAVLLTFDDGYRTVFTHALPILRRHGLPAVFFVCGGPTRAGQLHWYDVVARRGGEPAVEALRQGPFEAWEAAVAQLDCSADRDDPLRLMTPDDLARLAATPGMVIGAHTMTHPRLAGAPRARQQCEIEQCRAALRAWTGQAIDLFAYPTGQRPADYDEVTVDLAAAAGHSGAFTTTERFADPASGCFEQPRFTVVDGLTLPELVYRLVYFWR